MGNPEISILLPFYNAEGTLPRAIESMLNQTFTNFELILIDNSSKDHSAEIARNYCIQDERCEYLCEPKQGIVTALNTGLDNSMGKYVARMDADDWSFRYRLELHYSFLESNFDIDVVSGIVEYIAHRPETEGFRRYVNWSNQIRTYTDFANKQFVESPLVHPSVMWRKKISEKFGGYAEGDFPEDYELWLRWLSNCVKFFKIDKPVIKWCDSDQRLTRTDQRYSDQSFFKIKSKYLAAWLKKNNPFYPNVLVWGASKTSRKRAKLLNEFGIHISGYLDISNKRQLDREVIYYKDIPGPDRVFILVFLKEETMRSNTVAFLEFRGFKEGKSYLLVS